VVEFVDCAGKNVVCGLHTIHGRDKLDKTVPGFKGYSFSSKAFHDQIKRIAQGTKVFSISAGNFEEVYVGIPGKEEQKKIAALLSLIDQRISIQNKVIEKYESLIKALAYEIIGKNTANKTLSECVCCTSSTLKESDLGGHGAIPAYGAAGISGFTDNALSDEDSILITKDGSGVGSLRYVNGSHSFVGTLNSMTPQEGVYLPYIYYALQNVCFESYRTGQAIPHIYFKDYGKEAIYCPSFDNQKRLAKGLEMIDTKIGIDRAVLQSLQLARAYLLSAMFI
jgi:type I restriction enzyme S subunit